VIFVFISLISWPGSFRSDTPSGSELPPRWALHRFQLHGPVSWRLSSAVHPGGAYRISGWWLSPTPLKNDGVKVSWDYEIPNWMEKSSKCSKPPTRYRLIMADIGSCSSLHSRVREIAAATGTLVSCKNHISQTRYVWHCLTKVETKRISWTASLKAQWMCPFQKHPSESAQPHGRGEGWSDQKTLGNVHLVFEVSDLAEIPWKSP